jgi:hypothetical protein
MSDEKQVTIQCVFRSGCPHGNCEARGFCLGQGQQPEAVTSNLRSLIERARDEVREAAEFNGDDHSVGVCNCASMRLVDELTMALSRLPAETTGELEAVCEEIRNKAQSSVGNYGLGNYVAIHRELLGSMCAILDRRAERAASPRATSGRLFPRAWGCHASNGWTIDPELLIAIHDEICGEEFSTSQEGVELVLLAYERIRNAEKAEAVRETPTCGPGAPNAGACREGKRNERSS